LDPTLLLLGVGALGAASFAGFVIKLWNEDARRTRRVLRKATVVPIADLVDGQLACVVGKVEQDAALIDSMMEGRACVAFDTITHVVERDDFAAPVSTKAMRVAVSFFVVDATGRVRIDAPQAALCNKPSARARNWVERTIVPGATVRIVGSVVLDPTAMATAASTTRSNEQGFREVTWTATLTGTTKFPLLIDVVD
jgi:hypothetical protein